MQPTSAKQSARRTRGHQTFWLTTCVLITGMGNADVAAQECATYWTMGSHSRPVFICPPGTVQPPREAE